jgi:TRAP-type uncharacterized transport system substrate-binding protein
MSDKTHAERASDPRLTEKSFARTPGVLATISEFFVVSRTIGIVAMLEGLLVVVGAVFWFVRSAPPNRLVITSGPVGSSFYTNAVKYAKFLARHGVTLEILPSHGSIENLQRLADPAFRVDVGFVQGGMATNVANADKLMSLGSVAHQPLLVFYRGTPRRLLSEFTGQRLAIGSAGSGTRALALTLLEYNGIQPGGTTPLLDLEAEDASKALLEGPVDAVFLMGEAASTATMRQLLHSQDVQLLSFPQAAAYTRRLSYMNVMVLPEGSLDFGRDTPPRDVNLVGPTIELVARENLNPALSDLVLDAAREIHGTSALFQHRGEFPAPLEHEFRISADAARYYKSGKSFFYRYLPFWLASLTNRALVAFVPMVVILIPILRGIPRTYRWHVRMRILRWYRALLTLERELSQERRPAQRDHLLKRLDEIENAVNRMRVPVSFADQFYSLRGHISFVREQLVEPKT